MGNKTYFVKNLKTPTDFHFQSIFQENLLKTMIQIENSFFDLANSTERNCLVICDRGAMDASAFISRDQWENILARNGLDEVEVRDNRYSQVRTYSMTQLLLHTFAHLIGSSFRLKAKLLPNKNIFGLKYT